MYIYLQGVFMGDMLLKYAVYGYRGLGRTKITRIVDLAVNVITLVAMCVMEARINEGSYTSTGGPDNALTAVILAQGLRLFKLYVCIPSYSCTLLHPVRLLITLLQKHNKQQPTTTLLPLLLLLPSPTGSSTSTTRIYSRTSFQPSFVPSSSSLAWCTSSLSLRTASFARIYRCQQQCSMQVRVFRDVREL